MQERSTIRVELGEDGIAVLTLARPDVRNAIDLEMVREVGEALDELAADERVRVLILRGDGGKAFAAGADIRELLERRSPDALRAINATMFQRVEDFPRPTIAAIQGFALGGGCELALACDLRVAGEGARLGFPEVTLGIFPGAGGSYRLPRLVGLGRAKELVYTGRIVPAAEALAIGLVERVVPDDRVLDEARAMAAQIARNGPLAVQVAKLALDAVARGSDPGPIERLGQALLFDSPDKHDRMTAFLEQRARKEK